MNETLHITVRGRVQGVGFRAFTVALANRLGLQGWVRNSPNEREVEIIVRGSGDALESFVERLRQGPPSSHVIGLESHAVDIDEHFTHFSVRH